MSTSFVREILPWLAPPVVGAIIGYVVSDIAMRTILRPLVRRAVSNLITPETLRAMLRSRGTAAQLSLGISTSTEELLAQPLSRLNAAGTATLGKPLAAFLSDALRNLVGSRGFIYATREVIGRLVESLSAKKLREILGGPGLKAFVTGTLFPLLAAENKRGSLSRSLISILAGNVGTILDDRLLDELAQALEPYAPRVADRIVVWLKSTETRSYLSDRGRELLPRILEKLNLMQRFLLSAGQFDKRLTEKMPEIVDETITTLESIARDPAEHRKVLRLLVEISRDMRDGLTRERPGEGLTGALEHAVGKFLQGLGSSKSLDALYDGALQKALADDPTLGTFARQSLGMPTAEIAEVLSRKALELLTKTDTAQAVAKYVLDWANGAVVKDVFHVDPARKEKLDAFLLEKLLQRIDRSVPEIHGAIDLDHRLIPVIAAKLKWLGLFGAMLGLIIGLSQLLLRWVRLN